MLYLFNNLVELKRVKCAKTVGVHQGKEQIEKNDMPNVLSFKQSLIYRGLKIYHQMQHTNGNDVHKKIKCYR